MVAYIKRLMMLILPFSLVASEFDFSPAVDAAITSVNVDEWYRDVTELSSYNRYYQGDGIDSARDWLLERFLRLGLNAHLEQISIAGYEGYNIVAEIDGSEDEEAIYIVGAHYDAISENPFHLAPGAEDNASGTAALLTLAKVFDTHKPKATIRFIAFSGEEAGLYGSKNYVANLIANGEQDNVRGVFIMDMIGYTADDNLDALIESSGENRYLIDLLKAAAAHYTEGETEESLNYWGSDHVPFIDNGFLAALIIENDYDNYRDYHRTTDTVKNLNVGMAEVIIKMIAGALGYFVL